MGEYSVSACDEEADAGIVRFGVAGLAVTPPTLAEPLPAYSVNDVHACVEGFLGAEGIPLAGDCIMAA